MTPNVLFVTVDQWPAHLLGCAGHPTIETPTIDQLARSGTRFVNTYAETPICIPSRRSIMTGQTARNPSGPGSPITNIYINDQQPFEAGNNYSIAPADGTYFLGATLPY